MLDSLNFYCFLQVCKYLSNDDLRSLRAVSKQTKRLADVVATCTYERLTFSRDTPADIVRSFSVTYPSVKCVSLKNGKFSPTSPLALTRLLRQASWFRKVSALGVRNSEDCGAANIHEIGTFLPSLRSLSLYSQKLCDHSLTKLLSQLAQLEDLSLINAGHCVTGGWLKRLPTHLKSLTWIEHSNVPRVWRCDDVANGAKQSVREVSFFFNGMSSRQLRDILHQFPNVEYLQLRVNRKKFCKFELHELRRLTRLVLTVENIRDGFFWSAAPLLSVKEVAVRFAVEQHQREMLDFLDLCPNAATFFMYHESAFLASCVLRRIVYWANLEKFIFRFTPQPFSSRRQYNLPTHQGASVSVSERDPFTPYAKAKVHKWTFNYSGKTVVVIGETLHALENFSRLHLKRFLKDSEVAQAYI